MAPHLEEYHKRRQHHMDEGRDEGETSRNRMASPERLRSCSKAPSSRRPPSSKAESSRGSTKVPPLVKKLSSGAKSFGSMMIGSFSGATTIVQHESSGASGGYI